MEIEIREEKVEAGRASMLGDAWAAGGIINRTRKIHPMPVLLSDTP